MDEKQIAALREVFEQKFAHMPLRRGELKPDSYWTPTTACAWEGFLACYQHLAPMWQPIETAPRDGTAILAWNENYGARETRWEFYREGSIAFSWFQEGKGPDGAWRWAEPQNNWGSSWAPTHWMPLPAAPDAAREQEKKTC